MILEDTKNYESKFIYLEKKWRSGNTELIEKRQVSCFQEIIFATELDMYEGLRVFLTFNEGHRPNRTVTTFNVYKLWTGQGYDL